MQLKKINPNLHKALIEKDLISPTDVQESCFRPIKSGIDLVIQSEVGSGKTTLVALSVIQKLEDAVLIAPRAVVIVADKEKVLELEPFNINAQKMLKEIATDSISVMDNNITKQNFLNNIKQGFK